MLKLCAQCNSSPLPYVMVVMIAGVVGFITWLTLGLSHPEPMFRLGGAIVVFFAVGGTMLHYVVSCLRRHCQHQARFARRASSNGTASAADLDRRDLVAQIDR
jgi:hypothetical protein